MTGPFNVTSLTLPSTAGSVDLYATLRAALIAYTMPGGARLRDVLGNPERIYVRSAPDTPIFPYVTLLIDRASTPGLNSYRETMRVEVQIIGKPQSQLSVVEWALDIVDRCFLSITQSSAGLFSCRSRERSTLPLFTDPAEANTVAVRGVYEFLLWPQALTNRVT